MPRLRPEARHFVMDVFRKSAMPGSPQARLALQRSLYFARKRNRAARAPASPVGADRERDLIDNDIDGNIDNNPNE